MSNNGNSWRTQPMYTFGEASQLAGVSPQTVRNWLFGYTVKERQASPLFKAPPDQTTFCSFLQLIEIIVAAQFRKVSHTSFLVVKRAYDNAQNEWGVNYPFAHLKLKAMGGHIVNMISESPSFQAVDELHQWTIPGLIQQTIDQLEYESELAAKWYPVGKTIPIVVDPRISAGLPTIVGRGVTVEAIDKRFSSGQKWDFIAQDYELTEDTVQEVLRYSRKILCREKVTA